MKNSTAVTNLSNEKLEAMFNLCKAFNIEVISEGIKIDDCNMDEMKAFSADALYYEASIRESFHKYVKMYATVMS